MYEEVISDGGDKMTEREIRCKKAVFDAADRYIKCSVNGEVLFGQCANCVQYEHTNESLLIINRKK